VTTQPLTYQLDGTTALVQMDDGKANALSAAMIEALLESLARADKEAKVVVLTGRADRFCAGFDLRAMMASPESATALLRRGADLLMKLYGLRIPLVVACTGHALAGGALVLLTGDMRLGAAGMYRIGLNEVSIGLPVPVLAQALAKDRLAVTELSGATLLAKIYAPDAAVGAGYLDQVVPAEELLARAKEEAARLAALAQPAFAQTKARLRGATIAHVLGTLDEDMRSIVSQP
jgi:enoyl-CoA hydratase